MYVWAEFFPPLLDNSDCPPTPFLLTGSSSVIFCSLDRRFQFVGMIDFIRFLLIESFTRFPHGSLSHFLLLCFDAFFPIVAVFLGRGACWTRFAFAIF